MGLAEYWGRGRSPNRPPPLRIQGGFSLRGNSLSTACGKRARWTGCFAASGPLCQGKTTRDRANYDLRIILERFELLFWFEQGGRKWQASLLFGDHVPESRELWYFQADIFLPRPFGLFAAAAHREALCSF